MTGGVEGDVAASRDPVTGEVFAPSRNLSVDGRLRHLEPTFVRPEGVLVEVVAMGDRYYGYLDMSDEVRLIGEVVDDRPAVGAAYRVLNDGHGRRFKRA